MAGTGPRTNHQSRVDWWREQFQRQRKANLTVTDFCRQLGVSVTTFYYWKKRVHEAPPRQPAGRSPAVRPSRHAGPPAANFVPVSILDPGAGTSWRSSWPMPASCGSRGPSILNCSAAITAAGRLGGDGEGGD